MSAMQELEAAPIDAVPTIGKSVEGWIGTQDGQHDKLDDWAYPLGEGSIVQEALDVLRLAEVRLLHERDSGMFNEADQPRLREIENIAQREYERICLILGHLGLNVDPDQHEQPPHVQQLIKTEARWDLPPNLPD